MNDQGHLLAENLDEEMVLFTEINALSALQEGPTRLVDELEARISETISQVDSM